ncbi:MAG: hypothetical protein WC996_04035 [Peptostreptococcales bacterium]
MIVQMLKNKEVLQDTFLLSNRYDNKSTDIKINLLDEFVNENYFYYLICKSPDKNIAQFAVPLTIDLETKSLTYLVRNNITNTKGNWEFCLLIKEIEIVDGVINDDGLIAISEHFVGKVKSGIITEEELGEQPLEEPLQIIYDRVLAEEAAMNDREGIRITNEGGRVDAEILRQEAEGQREIVKDTLQGWLNNPEQFKGDTGEQGIQGETGKSIEYTWNGTQLGVRIEGETNYTYVNLKGDKGDIGNTGKSLEFTWNGTQLGIRQEGDATYQYVNLKGDKGDKGNTGKGLEFNWNGTQLGARVEGDATYQYVNLKGDKGDVGEPGTPGTNLNLKVSRQYDTYEDLPATADIGYMCLVGFDLHIFTENGWVNAGKLTEIDLDLYAHIDGGLFTDEYGVIIGESGLEALQNHIVDDDTHANLIIDGMEV